MDDYFQRKILVGPWEWPVHDSSLFGMFSFMDGDPVRTQRMMDAGVLPWWTFPQVKVAFWRPLSEITHWLDYQLWPQHYWLMHAQSIVWFGVLIGILGGFYKRIMGIGWLSGLAGLLFVIDNNNALPVCWLANRNAVIAAVFGVLSLRSYVNSQKERCGLARLIGPVWLVLALLASEAGLGIVGYLVAYALFLVPGKLLTRIKSLFPYVMIVLVYYIFYRIKGFGASYTGAYIDPGSSPLAFIKIIGERIPILLAAQFADLSADLYGMDAYIHYIPHGNFWAWILATFIVVCVFWVLLPLVRKDAITRFWLFGLLAALLPVSATFPSNRLLLFSGIGAAGVIARFLQLQVDRPAWLPINRPWIKISGYLSIFFVGIHLFLAPLMLTVTSLSAWAFQHFLITVPAISIPESTHLDEKSVILINPPIGFWGCMYPLAREEQGLKVPDRLQTLASGNQPMNVIQRDDYCIEIQIENGFLQGTLDQIMRGPDQPFTVNEEIKLVGWTVRILKLAENGQPSQVLFCFEKPLSSPDILIVKWQNWKFQQWIPYPGKKEILQPVI